MVNLKKTVRTALLSACAACMMMTAHPSMSHAIDKIGNGGGAWVCREANGTIRWSKLVDLFEATDEFGLTLAQYPGSVKDVVDLIQLRVFRTDVNLYQALTPYVDKLGYLSPNPPQVIFTDDVLQTIDDSLFRLKPSPRRCEGGLVAYEQTVNYKNDGLILVQSELFNSLPISDKAALIFHEALYKYRRDTVGDTNSVATRRIVGLVFSTLSTADLKKALTENSGAIAENALAATYNAIDDVLRDGIKYYDLPFWIPIYKSGFRYLVVPEAKQECDHYGEILSQIKTKSFADRVKKAIEIVRGANLPKLEEEALVEKINSTYSSGDLIRILPAKLDFSFTDVIFGTETTCAVSCQDNGKRFCQPIEAILGL